MDSPTLEEKEAVLESLKAQRAVFQKRVERMNALVAYLLFAAALGTLGLLAGLSYLAYYVARFLIRAF